MANVVGAKGQVVIAKEIRDRLGLQPGWIALQRLVDDHVEVYFMPPGHSKSLKGSLARHVRVRVSPGKDWDEARETAWAAAARSSGAKVVYSLDERFPSDGLQIRRNP